jgi:hypothetical protein
MKRNLIALGCAGLLAFGLSFSAFAGSTTDGDSDGVPDGYDNCSTLANGPSAGTGACNSQEDYDADGYGQPCDGDVDNSGNTLVGDLTILLGNLGVPGEQVTDLDCSGNTLVGDLTTLLGQLGSPPGPSGLACAGSIPCP